MALKRELGEDGEGVIVHIEERRRGSKAEAKSDHAKLLQHDRSFGLLCKINGIFYHFSATYLHTSSAWQEAEDITIIMRS